MVLRFEDCRVGMRVKRIDWQGGHERFAVEDTGTIVRLAEHDLIVVKHDLRNFNATLKPSRFKELVEENPVPVGPVIAPRPYIVGDEIEFINVNRNGGGEFGRVGERGVIVHMYSQEKIKFRFLDRVYNGFGHIADIRDVRLVVRDQGVGEAFFTVVYKTSRPNAAKQIMGFNTEAKAQNKRREIIENGGQVFGMKKVTLRGVA